MSWATALIVVIVVAIFLPWLFGEVASRFNQPDDFDHVADQKRRTAKRARKQSGEMH